MHKFIIQISEGPIGANIALGVITILYIYIYIYMAFCQHKVWEIIKDPEKDMISVDECAIS